MTTVPLRALAARTLACGLLASMSSAAAEEPAWDPGHRTTSRLPGEVRGEDATGDGVYGRFDGTFDLGLGAGAEIGDGGTSAALRASLHYVFMAGVYAGYTDSLGGDSAETTRALSFGVDLRPTFIPRWSNAMESGPSMLDLTIDSISVGLGAYFRAPRGGQFADRRGLELSLGFGVPLTERATSLWLGARGLLRWDDPFTRARDPASAAGLFTLAYHTAL